jgi:hypothetical protein
MGTSEKYEKEIQEVDQNMSSNFHVDHFAWIATEFE